MSAQDHVFSEHISSMLDDLEVKGMGKPVRGQIGMRSGNILFVDGIRQLKIDGVGHTNYEIVGYQVSKDVNCYDEIRFLASDVESVTRIGLKGLSPERASTLHAGKAGEMVETIMGVENEPTMDRFRQLGARCVDERPEWFTDIVRMQIDKFDAAKMATSELDVDTLKALLSEDEDEREVTTAVMLILIDFCYDALESSYTPYVEEQEWLDAAMKGVDERLSEYGV